MDTNNTLQDKDNNEKDKDPAQTNEKTKFDLNKEGANLPVVSYSRLNSYKTCPKAYKFSYIDKLEKKDKPYTIFGQFCHEVLENFHKTYMVDQSQPLSVLMKQSFIEARKNWNAKLTNEQVMEAFTIMQQYLDLLGLEGKVPNVVGVEREIWLPIENELIFYGFIDRVQQDEDGLFHVVDYKTTKDPSFLKDRTQLLLYAYSLYVNDDSISRIRSSYILLKHKMRSMVADHSVKELIAAKDYLLKCWREIQEDKMHRAAPMTWKCKNCDFLTSCLEGSRMMGTSCSSSAAGALPKYGKIKW